jgi:hypothetical protein
MAKNASENAIFFSPEVDPPGFPRYRDILVGDLGSTYFITLGNSAIH